MKQNIYGSNYGSKNNDKKAEWLNDLKMNYEESLK